MSAISRGRFAAGSVAALAGVGIIAKPARAAQFSWKWGVDIPVNHPISVSFIEATGKIRQDTNGQVDIRAFPDSQLGSNVDMLGQLRSGALEMLAYADGTLDTLVPEASIGNIAFAFPTRKVAFAAMDGDLGAYIRASIRNKGLLVTEKIYENGYRDFTTTPKPIRTVTDLQGLKLRVSPGKLRVDTFKSLGAAVTPISPNELYTALQTHIVDGQETSLVLIETEKLYEVQRYCSLSNHIWSGYWNLINPDKWNSLPPNFQAIVSKRLNESALAERRDNELLTLSMQDKLHRQGLAFNTVDIGTFKAKLAESGFYARWKENFGTPAWTILEKYSGKLS